MKISIFKIMLTVAFVLMAGYNMFLSQQNEKMSDLEMANIEALASDEGNYNQHIWERYYRPENDGYNCIKGGSETC